MLPVFIFTILPALYCFLSFNRYKFPKSIFLRISLSWFLGQYISTFLIYILAVILHFFTASVLFKASWIFLGFTGLIAIFSIADVKKTITAISKKIVFKRFAAGTIMILACLLFSYFLFKPHLSQRLGIIYTSPVYWDFEVHYPLIQNFVYGDNFPPENVVFAGFPLTYHYFFDFLTAIYSSFGLDLVNAVNFISIASFFFMLLAIIGLSEELFRSINIGIIAVLLTITSSSLRFINYFSSMEETGLVKIIRQVINNSRHPFVFSFVKGDPFGYNGTMFNIFYFIEERQMIFAVLFLIFSLVIFRYSKYLTYLRCLFTGMLLGLFFQWHLYATIIAGCIPAVLLPFSREKRKILFILIGFAIAFLLQAQYFRMLSRSEWFYPDVASFPRLNFNFPTMGALYPLSFLNAVDYYFYAYGFKIIFFFLAIFILFKKNKNILLLAVSFILPSFILTNTVQLSPISVYDNHKWFRPMNIMVDLLVSYVLVKLFFQKKKIYSVLLGTLSFLLLTLSGFIELMPFLNSKPTSYEINYQSPIITQLRKFTPPRATFLSNNKYVLYAGRKLFYWILPGQDLRLNYGLRKMIADEIYHSSDLASFCREIQKYQIDYVEFDDVAKKLPVYHELASFKSLKLEDARDHLELIETKKCEVSNI